MLDSKLIRMSRLASACFMVVIIALSASQSVYAVEKKDKAMLRKIQQIKQQMEAEKAEIQTKFEQDKAALDAKVISYEKESSEVKESYGREKSKSSRLSSELAKLKKDQLEMIQKLQASQAETQQNLDKTKADLSNLESKHTVAVTDLKANDTQRKELTKALTERENKLASCTEKNTKLHTFGIELVKIYDTPSAYEAMLRTEPFTQLKRVQLEEILQSYRDKLDDQKFDPTAAVTVESASNPTPANP